MVQLVKINGRLRLVMGLQNMIFVGPKDISPCLKQVLHSMMDFREKFEWGDPFYAIFVNKMFGKRQKYTVF